MLVFALYVSNHGFGHASRISALAEELIKFGVHCHIICDKPAFLFNNLDKNYFTLHKRGLDFGVVHGPNLSVDKDATILKLIDLLSRRNEIMETEVSFLRSNKVDLIIGDAPYLASDIAVYADIPVFNISNFDWYHIYSGLLGDDARLKPMLNTIWALYQKADYSFRLPFSTDASIAAFYAPESCGLLARKKDKYADIRNIWGLAKDEKLLLVMFGGEGPMDLDYEALCAGYPGKVISTNAAVKAFNHILVSRDADFLDLTYNADIILCKPGYSTLAEACQFGKFIVYCPRKNYPEELALIAGLSGYPNCRELSSFKLSIKEWAKLFASLNTLAVLKPKYRNHNTKIAGRVLSKYLELRCADKKLLSVFDLGTNNLNYALFDGTTRKLVHKAHVTTGLGKGFSKGRLSGERITATKHSIKALLELDSQISSEKVFLATGVSRLATNASLIVDWVQKKYQINSRIISAEEEIRYVRSVAVTLGSGEEACLGLDIGGASTEFVRLNKYDKGISLNLGLMQLWHLFGDDYLSAGESVSRQISTLPYQGISKIVGIGLSFSYLAAVLYKTKHTFTGELNGKTITLNNLHKLLESIQNGRDEEYLPWLLDPSYLSILKLSTVFCISVLDRFPASEIIVCEDGISVGYALWQTRRKK